MGADREGLERALDALLAAMIAEDAKPSDRPAEVVMFTAAELQAAGRMSRLDMDVVDLQRSPVRAACRQAVRRVGEHLFSTLGSTDAMAEVLERVADRVPEQYGARASIMDHAWDGIGSNSDRWWA